MQLSDKITGFLRGQSFVIITTLDSHGRIHASCKGIVEISANGRIYLLDLYLQATFRNLQQSSVLSLIAVDEHSFRGYCLKGRAEIIPAAEMEPRLIKAWDERIATRITRRVLENITGEKGHTLHPEAHLPTPQYLIAMDVEEVVDLTPRHIGE